MAAKDSHPDARPAAAPVAPIIATRGSPTARETSHVSETESPERRLTGVLDKYGRALKEAVARVCRGPLGLQRDEIEQEARIRLWRALTRETAIADVRPYLHRIVANAAIDAMRQVRSRREIPLDPPPQSEGRPSWPEPEACGPSPEGVVYGRELARVAKRILASLPVNRRRAVSLHLQGFTSEEIAQLMRWSEPKARNLVYRGLADLREKLRPELSLNRGMQVGPAAPDEVAR
jgi:RNA polymerase sigma factor (sigma-70 family)